MAQIDEQSTSDKILEETRRVKAELAAKLDFDVDRILDDARKKQALADRQVLPVPCVNEP